MYVRIYVYIWFDAPFFFDVIDVRIFQTAPFSINSDYGIHFARFDIKFVLPNIKKLYEAFKSVLRSI